MQRDQCLRVLPALRGAVFARARLLVRCARRTLRTCSAGECGLITSQNLPEPRVTVTPCGFPAACKVLLPGKNLAALDRLDLVNWCGLLSGRTIGWAHGAVYRLKSCVGVDVIDAFLLARVFAVELRHPASLVLGLG